jgi:hypothetical protein
MNRYNEVQHGPCPNCGKPKSAYMGSSAWGARWYDDPYGIMCCSDECGLAFGKKLRALRDTELYRELELRIVECKSVIRDLEDELCAPVHSPEPAKAKQSGFLANLVAKLERGGDDGVGP